MVIRRRTSSVIVGAVPRRPLTSLGFDDATWIELELNVSIAAVAAVAVLLVVVSAPPSLVGVAVIAPAVTSSPMPFLLLSSIRLLLPELLRDRDRDRARTARSRSSCYMASIASDFIIDM